MKFTIITDFDVVITANAIIANSSALAEIFSEVQKRHGVFGKVILREVHSDI